MNLRSGSTSLKRQAIDTVQKTPKKKKEAVSGSEPEQASRQESEAVKKMTKELELSVGTCGHSFCGNCFDILTTRNCPICRAEDSFVHKKNFLDASIFKAYTERE